MKRELTDKQRAFVENKAAGATNRDAAIAAGYSPTAADVTAAKLIARADIKAAIKAATKNVDARPPMERDDYPDAMTFLMDVMNCGALPFGLRIDAAKNLLPYMHARIGELGKKAKAKDDAGEASQRRAPMAAPPKLTVVKVE